LTIAASTLGLPTMTLRTAVRASMAPASEWPGRVTTAGSPSFGKKQ
jgi:hypothetical protein